MQLKRFRVIVQGTTRNPSRTDPDGRGFITVRSVVAESLEHAVERTFSLVRDDPRSKKDAPGPLLGLSVQDAFEVDYSDESVVGDGYIYYDGADD
jgi:hypothetical protein